MGKRIGIILLDGAEVIVAIFAQNRSLKWEKLFFQRKELVHYQARDLTINESQKQIDYLEVVATLAEVLLFGLKLNIKSWRVLSRNISDEILKQISQVTKLKIKTLDLALEQELICRGVLNGL